MKTKFSFERFVGFYVTTVIDTISTLLFFVMMSSNVVTIAIGVTFSVTKVWHWKQSFLTDSIIKKALHLAAWGTLAILSIIFLISMGLVLTAAPERVEAPVIVQTVSADTFTRLEEARRLQLDALIAEQQSLNLQVPEMQTKLRQVSTWGKAYESQVTQLASQLQSSQLRLQEIGATIQQIADDERQALRDQSEANQRAYESQMTARDSTFIEGIKNSIRPIGAEAMVERILPSAADAAGQGDLGVKLLFLFFGVVTEITLALSSLPEKPTTTSKPTEREAPVEPETKPHAPKPFSPFAYGDLVDDRLKIDPPPVIPSAVERIDSSPPVEALPLPAQPPVKKPARRPARTVPKPTPAVVEQSKPVSVSAKPKARPALKPIEEVFIWGSSPSIEQMVNFIHNRIDEETREVRFGKADDAVRKMLLETQFKKAPLVQERDGKFICQVSNETLIKLMQLRLS